MSKYENKTIDMFSGEATENNAPTLAVTEKQTEANNTDLPMFAECDQIDLFEVNALEKRTTVDIISELAEDPELWYYIKIPHCENLTYTEGVRATLAVTRKHPEVKKKLLTQHIQNCKEDIKLINNDRAMQDTIKYLQNDIVICMTEIGV